MGNFLSEKGRKALLDELHLEKEVRYAKRLMVILLLDEGKSYKSISDYLFLDEGSVNNYKNRYKEGGIDCLINDNYNAKRSLLSEQEQEMLCRELRRKIYPTAEAVGLYIERVFSVEYSQRGVTNLLYRLGFSYKKATAVPGKAKQDEQEKFVRKYKRIKKKGGLVYFADSTHPEWAPTITYGWIERGQKFEVKTNSGWKKRVNVCGAIEIKSLDTLVRIYKTVNRFSICDMLYNLRKKNPDEKEIHLILDGAAYNRALDVKKLGKKLKIKIVYLPPYSPNLNPIERLWKFMKKMLLPIDIMKTMMISRKV